MANRGRKTDEISTSVGLARVTTVAPPGGPGSGRLVLGHGAGGGIGAPDLVAVGDVALALGWTVTYVEQPYRVAGRRAPAPARQLDLAFAEIVAALPRSGPLITGGRSSGARVACRTAAVSGAAGVLCLAFPLHPPGKPENSRLDELEGVAVPVLIVQGERDPFGMPPARAPRRAVVTVPGDHSLRGAAAVAAAVEPWLVAARALGR